MPMQWPSVIHCLFQGRWMLLPHPIPKFCCHEGMLWPNRITKNEKWWYGLILNAMRHAKGKGSSKQGEMNNNLLISLSPVSVQRWSFHRLLRRLHLKSSQMNYYQHKYISGCDLYTNINNLLWNHFHSWASMFQGEQILLVHIDIVLCVARLVHCTLNNSYLYYKCVGM